MTHEELTLYSAALRERDDLRAEAAKLRASLNFMIDEIIDREGREGMTDYEFAEEVIALAQDQRAALNQRRGQP